MKAFLILAAVLTSQTAFARNFECYTGTKVPYDAYFHGVETGEPVELHFYAGEDYHYTECIERMEDEPSYECTVEANKELTYKLDLTNTGDGTYVGGLAIQEPNTSSYHQMTCNEIEH